MYRRVAVIGSGVVGLTSAITLAERGWQVTMYSSPTFSNPIASRVAPAMFTPYPGPEVTPRFQHWMTESLRRLQDCATQHPEFSGVFSAPLREYFYSPRHEHHWIDQLLETRAIAAPAGIEGVVGDRWHVDTLLYINWLETTAASLGIKHVPQHIASLAEPPGCEAIVNCTGLGARALVKDPQLVPMRGVVVHIPNDIGLEYSLHNDAPQGRVAYIFKFRNHLVLGGTFEPEREDLNIEATVLPGILNRCRELLKVDAHPRAEELSLTRATKTLVALRPTRIGRETFEDIRLELDRSFRVPVIHNYGHGRQGISMSWGTARDAADLVESACR